MGVFVGVRVAVLVRVEVGVWVGVDVGVKTTITISLSEFDVVPSTVAEAMFVTEPVVTSPAVTVYVAVQVRLSPASR